MTGGPSARTIVPYSPSGPHPVTDGLDAWEHCSFLSLVNAACLKIRKLIKREGGQCSQRSGAPVGPGGGTAKSPGRDGTAKAVRSLLGNLRTAVIVKDGGPYNVRQIGVGERAGLRGTAGDCGGLRGTDGNCRADFLLHSIISLTRQKYEYVQNIIREALSCSNKWRGGLLVSPQYRMIARSGTYLIYMVDHENNNEV